MTTSNHDDMPGEPCRCYKCLEARLAKCQEEKEKECNHIDMVNNCLTKRIDDLGQCLVDHNHQNNEEFRKIKDRLDEIEKSIADQAIKALHTHPEILQPLSDITKRISELDTRLQDQVDDHCGRIKDLEEWVGTPANEDWTTFKLQLMKQADRLDNLQEQLNNLATNLTNDYYNVMKRLNDWNDRQKI